MSLKSFDLSNDVASVVSSINEVVIVSSSIYANDLNIKYFTNIASSSAGADLGGYWQTVFDSSPTSSFSTAIMDMTYGYSTGSSYNLPVTSTSSQNEKIKIYRQMASTLLGNPDALFTINGSTATECFFILVKRGIQKDEIKKGSTALILNRTSDSVTGSDDGAVVNFKQTVGGDYAILSDDLDNEYGQVWYNAGMIVLGATASWPGDTPWSGSKTLEELEVSGTINQNVDGLRNHIDKIALHNQTNLYSTIFFCRAYNSEFNYSSNPTFVDDNKRIRVTSGSNILSTRVYITTIGLYDPNDNLLAVAKLNRPITKSPDTEATCRIRLDY
jgi:hypothetical protein